jgi:hypothetical protein
LNRPAKEQTLPPTIAVADQFPDGQFPFGEVMEYRDEYVVGFAGRMHTFLLTLHFVLSATNGVLRVKRNVHWKEFMPIRIKQLVMVQKFIVKYVFLKRNTFFFFFFFVINFLFFYTLSGHSFIFKIEIHLQI